MTLSVDEAERQLAEARRALSTARGAAKRSENTRPRTIEDVRKGVHDASVRVGALARRTKRKDFEAISGFLATVARFVSVDPTERTALLDELFYAVHSSVYGMCAWDKQSEDFRRIKSREPTWYEMTPDERGARLERAFKRAPDAWDREKLARGALIATLEAVNGYAERPDGTIDLAAARVARAGRRKDPTF